MFCQRVLILGSTGTLGGYLSQSMGSGFTALSPARRATASTPDQTHPLNHLSAHLEAADHSTIDSVLDEAQPDAVINCIAITPKHRLGDNKHCYSIVNASFPHALAERTRSRGIYTIHISSDAVFSGNQGGYTELDEPDPTDEYGRTKLAGEITGNGCLTLRTSFFALNSNRGGVIDWLLQQQGRKAAGYTNYHFSGMWIGTLAQAITKALTHTDRPSGIFHVGGQRVSKFSLLQRISNRFGLDIQVVPQPNPRCDRSLDSTAFWSHLNEPIPTVDAQLEAMTPELLAAIGHHTHNKRTYTRRDLLLASDSQDR